VNCVAVRERLPEHVLSLSAPRERPAVDRHLAGCAACRKEAEELEQAGGILAMTAPAVELPDDLGERIVATVRGRAHASPALRRRLRVTAVAASLAAVIAVGGLGWGAVMADRADEAERRAALADRDRRSAEATERLLRDAYVFGPRDALVAASLASQDGGRGQGWAFVLTRSGQADLVLTRAFDLPAPLALPLRVWVTDGAELRMLVDRVTTLDVDDGFDQAVQTGVDLSSAAKVVVKDAGGRTVLAGELTPTDG
jgi:hypothetical protein